MERVFISYSRKDIAVARVLHEALKSRGVETWIDWQDIPPSADWLAEIEAAIESSEALIFLISAASLDSAVCSREIAHAVHNHKRLIPIVVEQVDARQASPALAAANWIFLPQETSQYNQVFDLVEQALRTDLEWVKTHTRYQVRALEWERSGRSPGLLLRGADLHAAESWLNQAGEEKSPAPTALQTQYFLAGRQDATRRTRQALTAVVAALVVIAVLALVAWLQRGQAVSARTVAEDSRSTAQAESRARATSQLRAEHSEATAVVEAQVRATAQADAENGRRTVEKQNEALLSRRLAAEAELLHQQEPNRLPRALLLALEGYQRGPTGETDRVLRQIAAEMAPHRLLAEPLPLPEGQIGLPSAVTRLTFSPDGRYLAAGLHSGAVRAWRMDSGMELPLVVPQNVTHGVVPTVRALIFHPTRPWLAVGNDRKSVQVWDLAAGKLIFEHTAQDRVFGLDFDPSGQFLAAASEKSVEVLALPDGTPVQTLEAGALLVKFSPDGSRLAAANERLFTLTDTQTWRTLRQDDLTGNTSRQRMDALTCLAFSPDGAWLAVGVGESGFGMIEPRRATGGAVILLDPVTGAEIRRMQHTDAVTGLAFQPDSARLISSSFDGTARIWNPATGAELTRLEHNARVSAAGFLGKYPFSLDSAGLGRVWDPQGKEVIAWLPTEGRARQPTLALASTGMAAMGGASGKVQAWQAVETSGAGRHEKSIAGLAVGSQGELVLSLGMDGQARVWEAASLAADETAGAFVPDAQQALSQVASEQAWMAGAFSPDDRLAAAGSAAGEIVIWNARDGKNILRSSLPQRIGRIVFSPDGKRLAAAEGLPPNLTAYFTTEKRAVDGPTELVVLDAQSGAELLRLVAPGPIYDLAFSPDGTRLAAAGGDGMARIWEVDGGKLAAQFETNNALNTLAFDAQGRRLMTGTACRVIFGIGPCEALVQAWDIATGRQVWQAALSIQHVVRVIVLPEHGLVAAGGLFTNTCERELCPSGVWLWDLETGKELAYFELASKLMDLVADPEESWLAASDVDGVITVWDVEQRNLRTVLQTRGEPWSLAPVQRGARLAYAGWETASPAVHLLPLSEDGLTSLACSRLERNLNTLEWQTYLEGQPYRLTCANLPPGEEQPENDYVAIQQMAGGMMLLSGGGPTPTPGLPEATLTPIPLPAGLTPPPPLPELPLPALDLSGWVCAGSHPMCAINLAGVHSASADEAWAISADSRLFHYKDGRWAAAPWQGGGFRLGSEWAPGSSAEQLADFSAAQPTGLELPPDFASWSVKAAARSADGSLWLGAEDGTIYRQSAETWEAFKSGDEAITALAFARGGQGWALNRSGRRLQKTAAGWALDTQAPKGRLRSLVAAPDGSLWAVGDSGLILHSAGADWQIQPSPTRRTLYAIQALPDGQAWAVGDQVILHYDRGEWRLAAEPPVTLTAVSVDPLSASGWAVGLAGGMVRIEAGKPAGVVRTETTASTAHLNAVVSAGDGSAWVTDLDGRLRRYIRETLTDEFVISSSSLTTAFLTEPGKLWLGGGAGLAARFFEGEWDFIKAPGGVWFRQMAVFPPDRGWAVGDNYSSPALLSFDGNRWNWVDLDPLLPDEWHISHLNGVSFTGPEEGWAVGGSGALLHYSNAGWEFVAEKALEAEKPELNAVQMLDPQDGWIVGGNGLILHYDGDGWQVMESPTKASLTSLGMRPHGDGWAIGSSGTLLYYDGNAWSQVADLGGASPNAIVILPSGEGWIVGDGGLALYHPPIKE